MPNRRILKASDLSGIFIFQDAKRGTIFYDIFTRKGYILTSSDVRTYTIYTAMFPLCIVIALFSVSLFKINYFSAFLIFVALYLLASAYFRFTFFYKLPVAERWKPAKRESIFMYFARGFSKQRLLVLIGRKCEIVLCLGDLYCVKRSSYNSCRNKYSFIHKHHS